MKVLLENLLRFEDAGFTVSLGDVQAIADWLKNPATGKEIQYRPGARAAAGLHRRSLRGRPRGDARRDQGARRRYRQDQPAGARPPGHRPLGDGRRVRHAQGVREERRARIPAQRRALRLPQVGLEEPRQFPGGAAGHRHLPSGQPRAHRAGRVDQQGPGRRAGRLPGHMRRHRQPHDDGQRAWRARLGRRRDRGRSGDARPADLDADSRSRRLQVHRPAGRGRHGDRPRAHLHPDAPREGAWSAASSSTSARASAR